MEEEKNSTIAISKNDKAILEKIIQENSDLIRKLCEKQEHEKISYVDVFAFFFYKIEQAKLQKKALEELEEQNQTLEKENLEQASIIRSLKDELAIKNTELERKDTNQP